MCVCCVCVWWPFVFTIAAIFILSLRPYCPFASIDFFPVSNTHHHFQLDPHISSSYDLFMAWNHCQPNSCVCVCQCRIINIKIGAQTDVSKIRLTSNNEQITNTKKGCRFPFYELHSDIHILKCIYTFLIDGTEWEKKKGWIV